MSPGGARNDVRLVCVVSDAMVSTQQVMANTMKPRRHEPNNQVFAGILITVISLRGQEFNKMFVFEGVHSKEVHIRIS